MTSNSCQVSSSLPHHSLHSILCMRCLMVRNTAEGRKCHYLVTGHSDSKIWPLQLLYYVTAPFRYTGKGSHIYATNIPITITWATRFFTSHMCKKLGHFKAFALHCIQNKVAIVKRQLNGAIYCSICCQVLHDAPRHVILTMLLISPNDDDLTYDAS